MLQNVAWSYRIQGMVTNGNGIDDRLAIQKWAIIDWLPEIGDNKGLHVDAASQDGHVPLPD